MELETQRRIRFKKFLAEEKITKLTALPQNSGIGKLAGKGIRMNKNISVLIPTRKREKLCTKSILTLVEKCSSIENIEVIFGFDNDDEDTSTKVIHNISEKFPNLTLKYQYFDRKGYAGLNEYFDELIKLVDEDSDLILYWADDFDIVTQGWDDILIQFHIDNIFGAYFFNARHRGSRNKDPNFIIWALPKKWLELTKRLSAVNNTDSYIEYVARGASCIHVIDDITAYHDRDDNDETQRETNAARKRINQKGIFHSEKIQKAIAIDAEKIRNYINTLKN